jgi:glycerol-3-phosphate dehydrogenase subunit C
MSESKPEDGIYGEGAAELTGDEEHTKGSFGESHSLYDVTHAIYDPIDPQYWDLASLQAETNRTLHSCVVCGRCKGYCDWFDILLPLVSDTHQGSVSSLSKEETNRVMDACFQCKKCDIECPYNARNKPELKFHVPNLVHRYQANRKKAQGSTLRDALLSDPDTSAKMARMSLGLVNVMNRVELHRVFFEKIAGVHRKKELPMFAQQTFSSWAKKQPQLSATPKGEVALFQTCYVEGNEPDIGKDTVKVLEKNQIAVDCPQGLVCCGMPRWEGGDLENLQRQAKHNLDVLMPFVDKGEKVLAINPTCSMMLRKEYPELVAKEDRERAKKLAAAVMDPSEFLWSIRKEPRFNTDFKSTPGENVAVHVPCHLRAQMVGFKARDLFKKIPGVTTTPTVQECCGHDGTYAMKVESFEDSIRIGKKSFDEMKEANAAVWSTDCPLAATQFAQHAGKKPMHPMSILARAYEEDGFPTKVPPPTTQE